MIEIDKQSKARVGVVEGLVTAVGDTVPGSAVSRRRLLRAGLAAAPVMLALKSQSVLAADICIKPSAFSSLTGANMTLSRMPTSQGYACFAPAYWISSAHPPLYSDKLQSYFLAIPSGAPTGAVTAGFVANPGPAYTGMTLQAVLLTSDNLNNAELARYVVAAFLTAEANADNPAIVLLTRAQCKDIWDYQGDWSPMTGPAWTLAQTIAYFKYIYHL